MEGLKIDDFINDFYLSKEKQKVRFALLVGVCVLIFIVLVISSVALSKAKKGVPVDVENFEVHNLTVTGNATVEGAVVGDLTVEGKVTASEVITGNATVEGAVVGDLTVEGKVTASEQVISKKALVTYGSLWDSNITDVCPDGEVCIGLVTGGSYDVTNYTAPRAMIVTPCDTELSDNGKCKFQLTPDIVNTETQMLEPGDIITWKSYRYYGGGIPFPPPGSSVKPRCVSDSGGHKLQCGSQTLTDEEGDDVTFPSPEECKKTVSEGGYTCTIPVPT